jgi:hypothetical protein
MGGHGLLDVLGEVVPQVPAIGHLDRLGRTGAAAFGVAAGPVAADHLHTGMLGKPVSEGVGFTIGQQIDRSVAVHVYQHRAVDVTASQREVVDAEHGDGTDLWVGAGSEQPQQRGPADPNP